MRTPYFHNRRTLFLKMEDNMQKLVPLRCLLCEFSGPEKGNNLMQLLQNEYI